MKKNFYLIYIASLLSPSACLLSSNTYSHENHDPLIASVMLDKVEVRDTDNSNMTALEAEAWIGHDLNKFWIKTELEHHSGKIEHAQVQALYSHAIAPFWDLQTGLRQDAKPSPSRTWGVIGIQGLAPYFFEVDAAFFVGEAGRISAKIKAEYDLLFTQKLILSPEVEMNFFGQNDEATNSGAGLSNVDAGLRLRYEIQREFAPYIGILWSKKFCNTKDFVRHQNETVSDVQWTIGLATWF